MEKGFEDFMQRKAHTVVLADEAQKQALLTGLFSIVQDKARLVTEVDKDDEQDASVSDWLNTAQVLFALREAFAVSGDIAALCRGIREGFDTMVYEDVFSELSTYSEDEGLDEEALIELS